MMQYVMLLAKSYHPFMSARIPKETAPSLVYQTFTFSLWQIYFIVRHPWDENSPFHFFVSQANKSKQILIHLGSPWCIALP